MNHRLCGRCLGILALAASLGLNAGCGLKRIAINKLGDSLAQSGSTFSSDDDPEFIESAVPFSLKLIESLLAESPNHRGMLIAASSGFTQYAYAFIQQQADEAEDRDLARATALRGRARRMYLRARGYGIRALEVKHRGFEAALRKDAKQAVQTAAKADVPALYWTAASLGLGHLAFQRPAGHHRRAAVGGGADRSRVRARSGLGSRRHSFFPDQLRIQPPGRSRRGGTARSTTFRARHGAFSRLSGRAASDPGGERLAAQAEPERVRIAAQPGPCRGCERQA